jgi:hypothetical protein
MMEEAARGQLAEMEESRVPDAPASLDLERYAGTYTDPLYGELEVVEFVPDEKLVMRGYRTYESAGYLQLYEQAASGKCYMLRGVTGAFMDLLYGPPYPDGCSTFLTEEPLCRAKGDSYCEFSAERKRS